MSVDPRAKGARGETQVKDELKRLTGLSFERVPGSGMLHEKHLLKGDLYIVGVNNAYCIEVKNYAEDHINSSLLSSVNPQLIQFWEQTVRESAQVFKKPLLVVKFNRSKMFACFKEMPDGDFRFLFVNTHGHEFYIALLSDYIKFNKPKFIA